MSPLWPEALAVTLAPGSARLGRAEPKRGARADWEGALEALEAALQGKRGRVALTLSNRFFRLYLSAPQPAGLRTKEIEGFLRHSLEATFEEDFGAWQLRWQPRPPGEPLAVCAFPAVRLTELRQHLGPRLRLARVTPCFAAVRLAPSACVVQAEGEHLTVLAQCKGRWRLFTQLRAAEDAVATLRQRMELLDACPGTPWGPVRVQGLTPGLALPQGWSHGPAMVVPA